MTTKSTAPAAAIPLPRIHSTYDGGTVMGVMAGQDGAPDYLLVLLTEAPEAMPWQKAIDWAKSAGGELPTRREQSVLFGNRRDGQFKAAWYWSSEPYAGDERYAWIQDFYYGDQYGTHKGSLNRAVAVRRVPFQ